MGFSHCLLFLVFVGAALSFAGEFVPKSFYIIDENGHKSDVVIVRNKRDLQQQLPLLRRMRRSGGASSYSGASSGGSGYGSGYSSGGGAPIFGPSDIHNNIAAGLDSLAHSLNQGFAGANLASRSGAFSGSYSSSSSSAGAGSGSGSGSGFGSGFSSGSGGGHSSPPSGGGYNSGHGPQLFSRFGETKGDGVHVSGSASGPNGAFSSSSSSVDGNGNVKYSVQSGKY